MNRLARIVAKLLLGLALGAFLVALVFVALAVQLASFPYRRMNPKAARLAAGQQAVLAGLAFAAVVKRQQKTE